MPYSILKQKLTEARLPTDQFWIDFEDILFERTYSKDDIWLKEGNTGKKIAIITSGGAMVFSPVNSVRHISFLLRPNHLILSPSVFMQKPSISTFQFTEDSHVIQFSIEAIDQLREKHEEAVFYIDYFLGFEMKAWLEHIYWLKTGTAKNRYLDALKFYGAQFTNLTNAEKGLYIGASERRIADIKKESLFL